MDPEADRERVYGCGTAARWLARALGGAVLATTLSVALDARDATGPVERRVRQLVGVVGAVAALVIVRSGAELRRTFRLTERALVVEFLGSETRLDLASIGRLDWAPSFSRPGVWIPAAVLIDVEGAAWRVPALLEDGPGFVRELLARSEAADLRSWADERRLSRRMGRTRGRVWLGYLVTAVILAVGVARELAR